MIGQDPGKEGSWYEEELVALQLLRVLNGELFAVTWELCHEDGRGIDCVVEDREGPVAVQCKVRSTGQWTLKRLHAEGVLAHAGEHLRRDASRRFRFVSDAGCGELKRLCETARVADDPARWWQNLAPGTRATLQAAWRLPEGEEGEREALSIASRFEVVQLDAGVVDRWSRSLAGALSGSPGDLLEALRHLARESLTVRLREPDVRRELESRHVSLRPRPGRSAVHDRLEELARGFLERVAAARGPLRRLERSEVSRVVGALAARPDAAVLVHGPAGSGKTEVLAAAIERWREEDPMVPVLVLTPDMEPEEIGLGEDPIASLYLYAASGRAVLVIDQLDQVLHAGDRAQRLLRRSHRWIRRAAELGVGVVVGARTTDATADTQLRKLLEARGEGSERLYVGDLDEAVAADVLAGDDISSLALERPVRRLLQRPLALRLALDIHHAGGRLEDLTTMVSLVERWWETVATRLPGVGAQRAGDALDRLLEAMERDGVMTAPAHGPGDPEAVEALCRAGVLVRENRHGTETVRLFHQILADVRIARAWGEARTATDLLSRLGSRESQSLHQARRLRLAVPLLLDRPGGVSLLREIIGSPNIRPILMQSIFLGLAAVEDPADDLVKMVVDWLGDSSLGPRVLDSVIRGQRAWMEALSREGWLDRTWEEEDVIFSREALLDLLASVSQQWGDGVVQHLRLWQETDPTALDMAQRIFPFSPGDDSEALFEMRLEHLARRVEEDPAWDWPRLYREFPDRAVRLLEVLLSREDVNVLTGDGPVWAARLPTGSEIPRETAALGAEIWRRLRRWWCGLELRDGLLLVQVARGPLEEGALPGLVELLAAGLAEAVARKPGWFECLLGEMPSPLRELDGWLLLRTGARLPEGAVDAAGALARWFILDDRWAGLRMGSAGAATAVESFVRRIGVLAGDEIYHELETFLLRYREPWSREEEEQRLDWQRQLGVGVPSRVGWTAYRLLPLLPAERRSNLANLRIEELKRKFGAWERAGPASGAFYVRSPVPDSVAGTWTTKEWLRRLRDPRLPSHWTSSATWKRVRSGKDGLYTLSGLVAQLRYLAARDPRRFLPLALHLGRDDPVEAREALLFSLHPLHPSRQNLQDPEWVPLSDEEVASLLCLRAYLEEPHLGRTVAWAVGERPGYPWPREVRERLAAMAAAEPQPGIPRDHGLINYRMNETGCAALEAVAALARSHPELRDWALEVAASAVGHPDPGRRAGAGAVAAACLDHERFVRAAEILLDAAADPVAAAEHDVVGVLFQLASERGRANDAIRNRAVQALLAMVRSEDRHTATTGGWAAVWLRRRGLIGDEDLTSAMGGPLAVRRGMARAVARLLAEPFTAPWLDGLAVELVGGDDYRTANTVLLAFLKLPAGGPPAPMRLIERLVPAAAASGHDIGPLIEVCDREAQLRPVARVALRAAEELARISRPGRNGWHEVQSLTALLARLVEESERERDFDLRTHALDAWDRLLEANLFPARRALDLRMDVA